MSPATRAPAPSPAVARASASADRGRRAPWSMHLTRVALAGWLVAGLALGGVLLARHVVALPVPRTDDATLASAVAERAPRGQWFAVHVLYRPCPCSRRILDHLLATARPDGLGERVVLVDDHPTRDATVVALEQRGYAVEVLTPTELAARWHSEAAPLLIVADPGGVVRYTGGYGRHKQTPRIEDLAIIAALRADHAVGGLPLFGCATSARLARAVDPLGLSSWP